ncbi:MAG TPA: hypothetical protein VGJ63_12545 [Micromonosporaceae bacterium]|jgi:hypothetical protein
MTTPPPYPIPAASDAAAAAAAAEVEEDYGTQGTVGESDVEADKARTGADRDEGPLEPGEEAVSDSDDG